jgi:toxin ParE1/3/4
LNQSVFLTRRARADIDAIFQYHAVAASGSVAISFYEALERAIHAIADHPSAGSPRLGHLLNRPGLRVWPVKGFPHLIVYRTKPQGPTVLRVIHGSRDVPREFQD